MNRDPIEAFKTLDGTRPSNHGQVAAADADLADFHDRVGLLKLPAGQLEWFQNVMDLLDARDRPKGFDLWLALVADDADDGSMFAPAHVRRIAQLLDPLDDVVDLFFAGIRLDDKNHFMKQGQRRGSG